MGQRFGLRKLALLISTSLAFLLCGCVPVDDELYNKYYNTDGLDMVAPMWLSTIRGIYDKLRSWLVLIILLSIAMGIFLLMTVSKRNKRLKQLAIFGFLISIPTLVIIAFFAMAFYLNKYY